MKKVTIINQDSGYLMIDIANAFAEAGHEVTLITGRLVVRNTPLHPSIKLQKIVRYRRNNAMKRMLTWCSGYVQMLFRVIFQHRKAHLFIVSNPPFAPLLPLLVKNSFSLLIYDIYPDALSETGLLSQKSIIYRAWYTFNQKVYPKSERIFCLTHGMKAELEKYAGGKPIKIAPIWTDNQFFTPVLPENNPFIAKHTLQGKFVVMYSGNIGFSGEVGTLLEVAKEIHDTEIVFLIIGTGSKMEMIAQRIQDENIGNCQLLPWQEPSVLPYSLSAASLAVVTIGQNVSKLAIPSKTFNFLSVGAPVISIAPEDSDLAILINSNNAGRNFSNNQVAAIKEFILAMKNNNGEYDRLRKNALKLSSRFSPENAKQFLFLKKPENV